MEDQDPINRMSEMPDFEHLRETSHRPSWWSRMWPQIMRVFTNRTGVTIGLALAILAALGIWFWLGA